MRYVKGSFITIPNKELLKGQMPSVQTVFMWIVSFANEEGICYPSIKTIAEYAGMSEKTVDASIKVLSNIGIIEKRKRFKNNEQLTNEYQVLIVDTPQVNGYSTQGNSFATPSVIVTDRTKSSINSIYLTQGETEVSQEIMSETLEEYRFSLGWEFSEMRNVDGESVDCWVSQGKPISKSALESSEREFKRKHGIKTPQKQDEVSQVFALFKDINPAYFSWVRNKTQRQAVNDLLSLYEIEEIRCLLVKTETMKSDQFAPKISTPWDLLNKLSKIKNHKQEVAQPSMGSMASQVPL